MAAESRPPTRPRARLGAWRPRRVLAAAFGLLGVALAVAGWPARTLDVGPLLHVDPPGVPEPAHPTAAFQGRAVLLSAFVDLGSSAVLVPVVIEGASRERVFVRSARRTRAFLIADAPPGPLRWSPLRAGATRVRRHVQIAVPAEDAHGPVRLRLSVRGTSWLFLGPLATAGVLLFWEAALRLARRSWPVVRSRAAPILATAVALSIVVITASGPLPFVAHADETFSVEMTERLLTTGDFRMPRFKYPHLHGYLQASGPIVYGLARAAAGQLTHHDPFTNRLYSDGQPLAFERLFQPDLAARLAPEAIPTIRRAYACAFGILVLLAYALGARACSPRAGLIAALAIAVQPVLRDAAMLPNMTGALLAVGAGLLFLRLPATNASALAKGVLAGLLVGWKFNPTFGVLLVALLLIESPAGSRLSRTLLGVAAMPLGFWLAFPDLPWQVPRFAADIAREAFNYSSVAHPVFATDDPWMEALHQVHVRPAYVGNVALGLMAIVGTVLVALRFSWRSKWVLVWPVVGGAAFMLQQFLQLGRNYAIPVAYACLLAGVGGDALLAWAGRRWGRVGVLVAAGVIVAAALQVLLTARAEERQLGPTARAQAIAWIDAHAALGDRVILIESVIDELEGRQPDRARLQVRRRDAVPEERPGKVADYLAVNDSLGAAVPPDAVLSACFTGAAVWGSGGRYSVYEMRGGGEAVERPR